MHRVVSVLGNPWFWAAVFIAALILFAQSSSPCPSGYYWEEDGGAGCVRK